VLLNHGLLALGPTIPGTFMRMYMMERACEVELIARTLDAPPVEIDPEIVRKSAERMKKRRGSPEYGLPEWQGVLRTLERRGADYRR
jgi:ribulose-5-phosphate 4-epimerase/fuculose-1-phosphate aldolase